MCNLKYPKCGSSVTIDFEYNNEYEPGSIRCNNCSYKVKFKSMDVAAAITRFNNKELSVYIADTDWNCIDFSSVSMFINDEYAELSDFGHIVYHNDDSTCACTCMCTDIYFEANEISDNVLKQYGIDSYEYMEIINRLKDKFHMNTCSKCK